MREVLDMIKEFGFEFKAEQLTLGDNGVHVEYESDLPVKWYIGKDDDGSEDCYTIRVWVGGCHIIDGPGLYMDQLRAIVWSLR